jgi:hypothetical protein
MDNAQNGIDIDGILQAIISGLTIRVACERFNTTLGEFMARINTGGNELGQKYARAVEQRADALADQTIEIADDETKDPNRARNQIQARQWVAAKTAPKKFGDRIDLNVTQSIDIRAVLADARGRLRPMCDQLPTIDVQVIDTKQLNEPRSTDNESVMLPDPCDIFS